MEISLFYEIGKKQGNKKRIVCIRFLPNVPMFPWKYLFSMKLERSEAIKRELFA
jgi:hypothetical protein